VSSNYWRLVNRPYVHHSVEYAPTAPRGVAYRNWNVLNGATAVEAAVVATGRAVAPLTRAMGPLPTTSQVEAYPIMDRIKPAYGGAPTQQYSSPAPRQPVTINEQATVRAVPVNPGAQIVTQPAPNVPPSRSQPLPPLAPSQPQIVREQGVQTQIAPVQQPQVQQPQVQQPQIQQPNVRPTTGPMAPPSRVMAPSVAPAVQAQQPGQPIAQPLPQVQDTRRVAPAQGRGEAPVPRVEQPYVEPLPRAPRAMPQMPVRVQPVQPGDQPRRAGEEQPDTPKR
jgi:hypothetical protein